MLLPKWLFNIWTDVIFKYMQLNEHAIGGGFSPCTSMQWLLPYVVSLRSCGLHFHTANLPALPRKGTNWHCLRKIGKKLGLGGRWRQCILLVATDAIVYITAWCKHTFTGHRAHCPCWQIRKGWNNNTYSNHNSATFVHSETGMPFINFIESFWAVLSFFFMGRDGKTVKQNTRIPNAQVREQWLHSAAEIPPSLQGELQQCICMSR